MKNIILIISLLLTYSCQTAALYWFMSGDDSYEEAYKIDKQFTPVNKNTNSCTWEEDADIKTAKDSACATKN